MSEPTTISGHADAADWLAESSQPSSDTVDDAGSDGRPPRRLLAIRTGLVAAGAVIGGLVVAAVSHGSSTSITPTAAVGSQGSGLTGNAPLGGGPPAGGLQGSVPGGAPFGRRAGEQHLSGTLVSVGSSSVTVRTSSGTATYTVTSATEIVRNGRVVTLSALRAGDPVFVHVYPGGSGSRLLVERLFAGTSAAAGPLGAPGSAGGTTTGRTTET
jgi:hypothetical protein